MFSDTSVDHMFLLTFIKVPFFLAKIEAICSLSQPQMLRESKGPNQPSRQYGLC